MCIFFLVTLAATVAGVPLDCTEYCKSLSSMSPWLPWCDCSAETQELVASRTLEASSILDASQYHETDIYYEPDEKYFTLTKVLYQQPFYIKNPTFNFKFKTPKREVENKQSVKVTNNPPTEINKIIISQGRPLYLDISIEDSIESEEAQQIENIGPTENNLSECLDLHVVVFSRRGINTTLPGQISPSETLEKYKTMSDAEVIMAIKSRCTQPLEMVNRSLRKIQESQPKKKGTPSNTSQSSDNMPAKLPVGRYRNVATSKGENYLFDVNTNVSDEQQSDLRESNLDNYNVQLGNVTETLDLAARSTTSDETDSDNYTSESKLVSTRSTVGSTNTGFFVDRNFTHKTEEFIPDNSLNSIEVEASTDTVKETSTYTDTTDSYFFTEPDDTFSDGNETNGSGKVVLDEIKTNYSKSQDSISANKKTTALFDIENYSTKANWTRYEIAVESTTTETTPMSVPGNREGDSILTESTTNLPLIHEDSSTPQLFNTTKDDISEENYNYVNKTDDVTRKFNVSRQIFKEREIMIPKILTKELANGSVVSTIQGYEILPNGDFTINIDDSSYEDSITAESELLSSRRSFDSAINQQQSGISGNLYFVFDQALIPAGFLQTSDGQVRLGLNGNSMCEHFLKNHKNRSQFLLKLCTAVIDNKYDKISSVSVHDV